MPKLRHIKLPFNDRYTFYCRGCGCDHSFDIRSDMKHPSWTFNDNFDLPTFEPSLLYPDRVCHLFVRNGKIEYLMDCSHNLAGEVIEMEEVESGN